MSTPTDPLTPNTLLPEADLAGAARDALAHAGVTQQEAAEALGQTKAAVSYAVTGARERGTALRIEIIERFGGARVRGPLYAIEPASDPDRSATTEG